MTEEEAPEAEKPKRPDDLVSVRLTRADWQRVAAWLMQHATLIGPSSEASEVQRLAEQIRADEEESDAEDPNAVHIVAPREMLPVFANAILTHSIQEYGMMKLGAKMKAAKDARCAPAPPPSAQTKKGDSS